MAASNTSSSIGANVEVILERVEGLKADIGEVKVGMTCIGERQAAFEKVYILEHQKVVNETFNAKARLDGLDKSLEEHRKLVEELRKVVQPLTTAYRILVWMGTILGGSVLVLVWMLITGEVRLVFGP